MEIKSGEIRAGKKLRKMVYLKGVKYYAEIKIEKLYPYKIAHSRDLRKKRTRSDR
jgi:hypothetical protein